MLLKSLFIFLLASPVFAQRIDVYFNKSIDARVARGEVARGNENFPARLIERIDSATTSIDCCLYSFSGAGASQIANHLITAKHRGVRVRFIVDNQNNSSAPQRKLVDSGITIIDDAFGTSNSGSEVHHNKFFVIDADDSLRAWLVTGSWNPTDQGTNFDRQNCIAIQSRQLAQAYRTEFDEEWGSQAATPDSTRAHFSKRKTDNTPHTFSIDGTEVLLRFSPTDHSAQMIGERLGQAQKSINFSTMIFTYNALRDTLLARKAKGVVVRGLIDSSYTRASGSEFDTLAGRCDVRSYGANGILHHKYAVIDGEWVTTGSHNWTAAAETDNDENAIAIHSSRIANLYYQEWVARYLEAGGDSGVVEIFSTEEHAALPGASLYPNPTTTGTTLQLSLHEAGPVQIVMYDALGRQATTLLSEQLEPGSHLFSIGAPILQHFQAGTYFISVTSRARSLVLPIVLIR